MQSTPWLVRQPQKAPQRRLFCFSYAGGGPAAYAAWQQHLGPAIEVCAVQLPGRGARFREAPWTSLAELATAIAGVLRHEANVPFAFFGHSLGALLAFEVARQCQRTRQAMPAHLFASGCNAPQRRAEPRNLHLMDDAALLAELKGYNGTPPEILQHRDLMELVLPTIRADFRLAETYRYQPSLLLDVPVTVLAGRADEHTSAAQVEAWALETSAPCQLEWFDGDHFFLQPCMAQVLATVKGALLPEEALQP